MERRDVPPESWLWETEDGRQWLTRLVVATLYTFGLKRGVGLETVSEFFARLHLEAQVGCSPPALRSVMQVWERALLKTVETWEHEACTGAVVHEIMGAVDATFVERMMLVLIDLPTGYLVLEAVADDRTYTTWKALVDERLQALGAEGRSLVSDRAKALRQLADQGCECLSMPDCFHCLHALVKRYSLAMAQRVRHAHPELQKAEAVLSSHVGPAEQRQTSSEMQQHMAPKRTNAQRWEEGHRAYRQHLETRALTLPPFPLHAATPQTSAPVYSRLQSEVDAIATLAQRPQLPARPNALKKVQQQLPALAALVDGWWEGVEHDLEHAPLSAPWTHWAKESLLPTVYWEHHVAHTRCVRRQAKLRQACEAAQTALHTHVLTLRLPAQALAQWRAWAMPQVHAFQRASSAVAGRHGVLAQLHHNQRGLPKRRYKVGTVLPHFDGRAVDGTTPASRFFKRTLPDLFETVLTHMHDLPRPRQRKPQGALTY